MHAFNAWKAFGKGLIATRDESRVIGTFHVANDHPEKDYIRALVLRAEALEAALSRVLTVTNPHNNITPEYRASVESDARELLDEITTIRMGSHPGRKE